MLISEAIAKSTALTGQVVDNATLVRYAKMLGREDDPVVKRCKTQLGKYDGVIVGESGQIKEFREERKYGEIGDPRHRHISQLCGLYPCAIMNRATPEWLKVASRTLDLRGYRADEALEKLIAYMDDAQMVGAGEVTILHGTGTGALKQLTRDYLNDLNRQRRKRGQVALDFGDGDVNHGGAGLTIVQL